MIYIAPESTNESGCRTAPEPVSGIMPKCLGAKVSFARNTYITMKMHG